MKKELIDALDALGLHDLIAAGALADAVKHHLMGKDVTRGGHLLACLGQLVGYPFGKQDVTHLETIIGHLRRRAEQAMSREAQEVQPSDGHEAVVVQNETQFQLRAALLLDLNGTVRRNKNGGAAIRSADDIELMPGLEERVQAFRRNGFIIVGLHNEAGLAGGDKTMEQIDAETAATLALFGENPFHTIEMSFTSAYGVKAPWKVRSLLEKPQIGMLANVEKMMLQHGVIIDWNRSILVGDRPDDEVMASNANVTFMHIKGFLQYQILDGTDDEARAD